MTFGELGARLRAAGLTPRALAAWAGTDRISALPARVPALATHEPLPAAAALTLFVAGAELAIDRAGSLPIDDLLAAGLVERAGERIRARVAIVPHGRSLLVCDRVEAEDATELVAWPDDSSHHLAAAIPAGRRTRWLDLGCGSAFAQLARPELATSLVAIDANPRAIEHARLGAMLSGLDRLVLATGAIADVAEPADLVTCNAPIPDARDAAIWRRAEADFFGALWPAILRNLAPDGLAVVHALRTAIPDDLPGERVIVSYAPAFAVLWWRPTAPPRTVMTRRTLTVERPHVDARDRDDALDGSPC